MKHFFLIAVILMLFSAGSLAQAKKIESIYTDLTVQTCKELESAREDGILYRGECKGVSGYKLIVLESDLRQSLNFVGRNGFETELNLWLTITAPQYSYLGKKAEWRVVRKGKKVRPIALILRFNAYENPNNPEKAESYLVVVSIETDYACITNVVKPMKNQNVKARELADAGKPCLSVADDWRSPSYVEEFSDTFTRIF